MNVDTVTAADLQNSPQFTQLIRQHRVRHYRQQTIKRIRDSADDTRNVHLNTNSLISVLISLFNVILILIFTRSVVNIRRILSLYVLLMRRWSVRWS